MGTGAFQDGGEMTSDIVMIALVLAGIALTLAYFFVAVQMWRRLARTERQKEAASRRLHAERLTDERRRALSSTPSGNRQIAA
jgi:C4-dicarboxylate-specific signal transduction histidine kinase